MSFGQENGVLTGALTDHYTDEPLFGVKIRAWGQGGMEAGRQGGLEAGGQGKGEEEKGEKGEVYVTLSNEDGEFSLEIPAGTYNIKFNRYGLQEFVINGIIILTNDTVSLDTALTPVLVPLAGVRATIDYYQAVIEGSPSGPAIFEKSNENGELSDLFIL